MRKMIKKYGDTAIINFTKEELEVYNLNLGDIVEVEKFINDKIRLVNFDDKEKIDWVELGKLVDENIKKEVKENHHGTSS